MHGKWNGLQYHPRFSPYIFSRSAYPVSST